MYRIHSNVHISHVCFMWDPTGGPTQLGVCSWTGSGMDYLKDVKVVAA